jgi:hypothetical protein
MLHLFRFITIVILIASLTAGGIAQSDSSTANPSSVTPESGFISPSRYTNAFFGFTLPLPKDSTLGEFAPSFKESTRHLLFGLQSQKASLGLVGVNVKVTAFTVTAAQSGSASPEEAQKAAAGPQGRTVTHIGIGGRQFWKSASEQKVPQGKMHSVAFATVLNGYVLQFNIESFDRKLTEQLQHSIEAITFFEPGEAAKIAGTASRRYNPSASQSANVAGVPSSTRIGQLNPGVVSGNTYTNDALGFDYQFPSGWVVNDKAAQEKTMEAGHQLAWGNSASAAREHEAFKQCARVLLWVTKNAEGTRTEELNPLIVVIATDSACFPGAHFPTSVDDRDAIRQVAQQLLRSLAGTPFLAKGQDSVKVFPVQGHLMLDVSGSFTVTPPGRNAPLDIFTSLDVTEAKNYWVAWGFMSGSQAGLQELKNTKIKFVSPPPVTPSAK